MRGDYGDGPSEVGTDHLFSRFDRQADPVVNAKIEALPLHARLTPDNFERLIARLANPGSSVSVRAHRYGRSGSTQGGIDIICSDPLAPKSDYFEGKRWEYIAKGDITNWVEKFLGSAHVSDARRFVLCTTFEVFQSTQLADEWKNCEKLLASKEIDGELWDGAAIHTLLRYRHDIVSELFGDAVADAYCVQRLPTSPQPIKRTFERERMVQFGRAVSLENISVACDALLPGEDELTAGAALSFAREELSGISITISGKELVHWMQWRSHAQPDSRRPYALPANGDSNRFFFIANAARCTLHHEELLHFEWILQRTWEAFRRDVDKQLNRFRCARFRRLKGSSGPFLLALVDRTMWRAILEFANAHDVANGGGPWHIFDSAPGCLKVYTRQASDKLDHGYHTTLYAYQERGSWLPWEETVAIGWPGPPQSGRNSDISPRSNWDAEYTHDWLLEELIPAVRLWKSAEGVERGRLPFLRRSQPTSQTWSGHEHGTAISRAIGRRMSTVPEDHEGLKTCIEMLQSHFNGRHSDIEIEPSLAKAVLSAIDRSLSFAKLSYEGYLRGSVGIPPTEDLVQTIRTRAREEGAVSQTSLDFMLRGLLEVMDAVQTAPAGEWRRISATLQPLLDRYNEDLICDLFTSD